MKKAFLLSSCLIYSLMLSATANAERAKCTIPGYRIQQDEFREIIKEFILHERQNNNDYSPDWIFTIDIGKVSTKDEYEIIISSLQIKADLDFYIDTNKGDSLGCIHAFGHRILIKGDYKGTRLFVAIGDEYTLEYEAGNIFNSFPDTEWVKYVFKKAYNTFERN